MPEPDWVKRAQQGEAAAIAALLTRALQQQQINVNAKLDGVCVSIALQSANSIDQASTIALIQQGINRLQPANIQSVLVEAQSTADGQFGWIESFMLDRVPSTTAPRFDGDSTNQRSSSDQKSSGPRLPESEQIKRTIPSKPPLTARPLASKRSLLQPKSISNEGIGALLTGLILAIVLFSIGLLNTLFRGFLVLVHELGHAITHWLFGRPAIPTVNILYGGGITLTFGQVTLLIVAIYAAIAYLAYCCRAYPRVLGGLGMLAIGYSYCLLTPTNLMLSTFMGHGMELVAIGGCLYLAASGYLCRIKGDRAIYAMLGFFTLFSDVQFSWRLAHDPEYREWYEGGVGGVLDNDFVILAIQYFNVDLSAIANFFLICCLLVPAIAFLLWRYEPWCLLGVRQLLKR